MYKEYWELNTFFSKILFDWKKMITLRGNHYFLEPMSPRVLVWTPASPLWGFTCCAHQALALSTLHSLIFADMLHFHFFLLSAHQGNPIKCQSASAYIGQYTKVWCLCDANNHSSHVASCLFKSHLDGIFHLLTLLFHLLISPLASSINECFSKSISCNRIPQQVPWKVNCGKTGLRNTAV